MQSWHLLELESLIVKSNRDEIKIGNKETLTTKIVKWQGNLNSNPQSFINNINRSKSIPPKFWNLTKPRVLNVLASLSQYNTGLKASSFPSDFLLIWRCNQTKELPSSSPSWSSLFWWPKRGTRSGTRSGITKEGTSERGKGRCRCWESRFES